MGKTTNISWTNKTHNFWFGCKKISPGCRSCYAERDMNRFGHDFSSVTRSKGFDKPLKWKDPATVFTCSWSDFFIEDADEWREEAWDIIRETPHLNYQILTKRPENIRSRLPRDWDRGWNNVWLGVTIETQEQIHLGWILANLSAKLRFLSIEPLIDKVDLHWLLAVKKISWVIVGGESGPNYRPMELGWVRSIKEDCDRDPSIAFFMKQDHGFKPGERGRIPEDLWIQEFPVSQT